MKGGGTPNLLFSQRARPFAPPEAARATSFRIVIASETKHVGWTKAHLRRAHPHQHSKNGGHARFAHPTKAPDAPPPHCPPHSHIRRPAAAPPRRLHPCPRRV